MAHRPGTAARAPQITTLASCVRNDLSLTWCARCDRRERLSRVRLLTSCPRWCWASVRGNSRRSGRVRQNQTMDFQEKRLYHQVHPIKLAVDIGVTFPFLYFLWQHQIVPALVVGFVPPAVVSAAMIRWTPDLEGIRQSAVGRYLKTYMTPAVEAIRLLTLVPMAFGAWNHEPIYIALGVAVLVAAWGNGLIWRTR